MVDVRESRTPGPMNYYRLLLRAFAVFMDLPIPGATSFVRDITRSYGSLVALHQVSFRSLLGHRISADPSTSGIQVLCVSRTPGY